MMFCTCLSTKSCLNLKQVIFQDELGFKTENLQLLMIENQKCIFRLENVVFQKWTILHFLRICFPSFQRWRFQVDRTKGYRNKDEKLTILGKKIWKFYSLQTKALIRFNFQEYWKGPYIRTSAKFQRQKPKNSSDRGEPVLDLQLLRQTFSSINKKMSKLTKSSRDFCWSFRKSPVRAEAIFKRIQSIFVLNRNLFPTGR